nr:hypothetical protein [Chromatium okenii]
MLIVTVHCSGFAATAVQPLQLTKVESAVGAAVSVIVVPLPKTAAQAQLNSQN